jgi:hypothetical protein
MALYIPHSIFHFARLCMSCRKLLFPTTFTFTFKYNWNTPYQHKYLCSTDVFFSIQRFALYSNTHFCFCSYSICVFGCAKPLGIISALHKKQSLPCLLQTFLSVTCRRGFRSGQKAAVLAWDACTLRSQRKINSLYVYTSIPTKLFFSLCSLHSVATIQSYCKIQFPLISTPSGWWFYLFFFCLSTLLWAAVWPGLQSNCNASTCHG